MKTCISPHLFLILLSAAVLALNPVSVLAQDGETDSEETDRPKIGLVLGGGGARGGAHIGVIQVLHEMNIPIDYVAGTSMGSIVGSLYAIGLRPDEIESSVLSVDWSDLFSDRPERTQRIYRRKQDTTAAFIQVEWGWKNGLVLASGVVAGQKLSFAFREPSLYLSGHHGFDDLPYPFRAVTTDLQTGEMFVPEEGNLLKAVRASMSIPGVFPPVHWGDRVLVDGYLARNLPVDVCRAMGADIIIAVDVGELPENIDPESLKTLMGINGQKGRIGSRQNVDPQVADADIVIHPDLDGFSSHNFTGIAQTIEPGRRVALAMADQLKEYSLSPDAYAAHLARHTPEKTPPLIIDEIVLVNKSDVNDKAILEHIHQETGRELDLDQLKIDLAKIYDFGVFELIDFELRLINENLVLVITANPKYYAPNIINFGVSYEGGEGGKSDIEMRMRWTRMEMNAFGAELRTDVQIGTNNLLRSEFYQPLTWARRPFFALTGKVEHDNKDWYQDQVRVAQYKELQATIRPEVGLRLGHYGEIRGGIDYGYLRVTDRTGDSLADFDGPRGGFLARASFDMMDLAILPRNGYLLHAQYFRGLPEFGSDLDYSRLEGGAAVATTVHRHTFSGRVVGGGNLDTTIPEFHMYTLGGLSRLSGYNRDQFRGQAYGLASASWYHLFSGSTQPYTTAWYIGIQGEAGNAWQEAHAARWEDLRYSGLVTIVATTIIGPVAASYGQGEGGHNAFYITVGTIRDLAH